MGGDGHLGGLVSAGCLDSQLSVGIIPPTVERVLSGVGVLHYCATVMPSV